MKKLLAILLAAMLLLGLAACKDKEYTDEDNKEMTLVVQRVGEEPKEYPSLYVGDLTVEAIAMGLSELTGLRFGVTAVANDYGAVTVDWSADGTLFTGPSEEQNEGDFPFSNYESLAWFMLDSLNLSVARSLSDLGDLYYSMDGGKTLVLDTMPDPLTIPLDEPYLGSDYFLAQMGGGGEPVDPADVNWWGAYGEDGWTLNIDNYDGKSFHFTLDNGSYTDEGVAALDPENPQSAEYIPYSFYYNRDDESVDIIGGNFRGTYPRITDAVG